MKLKWRFLVFLLMCISICFFIPKKGEEECERQSAFNALSFRGVVKKKYIDKAQHSTPIIIIESLEFKEDDTLDLFGNRTDLFNVMQVKDTIVKYKGNHKIYKETKDSIKEMGMVKFGCLN